MNGIEISWRSRIDMLKDCGLIAAGLFAGFLIAVELHLVPPPHAAYEACAVMQTQLYAPAPACQHGYGGWLCPDAP